MIRFAYPNVNVAEERFLGCGRYLCLPSGQQPPTGYTEVTNPRTPNLAPIRTAVARLVRQPRQSEVRIYEGRDQNVPYQGTSLDLAYYLAQVHQTWRLRVGSLDTPSDIWCTGAIPTPTELQAVDPDGFTVKLTAFLADTNPDKLFFVPLAFLAAPHAKLCTTHGARTLTLTEFKKLDRGFRARLRRLLQLPNRLFHLFGGVGKKPRTAVFEQKTVVTIRWDELKPLGLALFAKPQVVRWTAGLATLVLVGLLIVWRLFDSGPLLPTWLFPGTAGPSPGATATVPWLEMTDPAQDGREVRRGMTVQGTAVLPPDQHLWVLVRHKDFVGFWWPQGEGQINLRTSQWRVDVTFGVPDDITSEFEIAVISVDQQGHQVLQEHWTKARHSHDWQQPIPMPQPISSQYRTVKKVSHE